MKKRFLAALLSLLMLTSFFAGCGGSETEKDDKTQEDTPSVNDEDTDTNTDPDGSKLPDGSEDQPTADDPSVFEGDNWIDTEKPSANTQKVHQKAESIPASATLIGTEFLPPIGNQGSIGSCSSSSIAYCQFSNAVARYLYSLNPKSDFKPSTGKSEYLISSKFAMNFSGAGTAWVYDVLKDHGALTRADSDFWRNSNGAASGGIKNDPYLESSSWDVEQGELEKALNIRLTGYEQIWMNTYNYQLTTTEKGKALVEKIKDAVATGNVVVTGGFSTYWRFDTIDEFGLGDLGKKGDQAIIYSSESGKPGGHQVSIVGYDDNITYTCAGVTMKGAFQVANSWGDWKNDGYVWLMYDAINKVSEYPELQTEEVNSYSRYLSISQGKVEFGIPLHLKELNTDITLMKRGTATVEGKEYPTYYIKCNKGFVTYEDFSDISVTKAVSDQTGLWAIIPASDLSRQPGYDKDYEENSTLAGGYFLYAVNTDYSGKIMWCGAALSSQTTEAYLTSVSRMYYTYDNICLKLEGYSNNVAQQTIRILGNNGVSQDLKRIHTMDQFCFIYWDQDLEYQKPGYTVTVEVDAKNREGFYLELTRKDASGQVQTYVPAMFRYGANFANVHPNNEYCSEEHYLNFKGEVDGNDCTGYFTLSYAPMLDAGADFENYVWGINIMEGTTKLIVKKITLKDENGNVLSEIVPEITYKAYGKYVFDLGNNPESYKNTGLYHLQNANGQFINSTNIILLAPGDAQNATGFEITYDVYKNEYTLTLADKQYILDIMGKNIVTGAMVKFNARSATRNTQSWRVIENEDGTVTIRLAADTRYAVGLKDGNICLVAGADIAKYGKWTLHNSKDKSSTLSVEKIGNSLTVNCPKPSEGTTFALNVTDAAGNVIAKQDLVFDANGTAQYVLNDAKAGTYVFSLWIDGKASTEQNHIIYTVK